MLIRIEGTDLPGAAFGAEGHRNVHVGVQRRGRPDELLDLVSGDAASVTWTIKATVTVHATFSYQGQSFDCRVDACSIKPGIFE